MDTFIFIYNWADSVLGNLIVLEQNIDGRWVAGRIFGEEAVFLPLLQFTHTMLLSGMIAPQQIQ